MHFDCFITVIIDCSIRVFQSSMPNMYCGIKLIEGKGWEGAPV